MSQPLVTAPDEASGGRRLRHLAIIPDGNRRWGEREQLPRAAAYEQGERTIFATVEACRGLGVEWVTFFLFSTENWQRSYEEVEYLVGGDSSLLYRMLLRRGQEMHVRNIRFRMMGRRSSGIAANALQAVAETEELTRHNTGLNLVLAIDYGGREEIVRAARQAVAGQPAGEELTEAALRRHLDIPEMPDVDLLVRTSGEQRISNYLLWRLAYAELAFLDVLWPEFGYDDLLGCVSGFEHTERRFGR